MRVGGAGPSLGFRCTPRFLCEEMIGIEKQYLIDSGEDAYYLSYRENEEEYDY